MFSVHVGTGAILHEFPLDDFPCSIVHFLHSDGSFGSVVSLMNGDVMVLRNWSLIWLASAVDPFVAMKRVQLK